MEIRTSNSLPPFPCFAFSMSSAGPWCAGNCRFRSAKRCWMRWSSWRESRRMSWLPALLISSRKWLKTWKRERDREKSNLLKEDVDASGVKRRKLKREHLPSEPGEYSPAAPPPPPLAVGMSQSYDGRDRERKGAMMQRGGYMEDPSMRIHGKEAASKMACHDTDLIYDREWDDEKRQRPEQKRRHRK